MKLFSLNFVQDISNTSKLPTVRNLTSSETCPKFKLFSLIRRTFREEGKENFFRTLSTSHVDWISTVWILIVDSLNFFKRTSLFRTSNDTSSFPVNSTFWRNSTMRAIKIYIVASKRNINWGIETRNVLYSCVYLSFYSQMLMWSGNYENRKTRKTMIYRNNFCLQLINTYNVKRL